MNNPQSYLEHEKTLNSGSVNRAAALFPFWIGHGNETFIVFQNYWKWKRNTKVEMILTIYDNFGKILTSIRQNVELNSYELAISKFLKENQKHITSGMAEL